MSSIQQPIQVPSVPVEADVDASTDGSGHIIHRAEGHPIEPPALDPRDRGLRGPRPIGQVDLAEGRAVAQGPDLRAEPRTVHAVRMAGDGSRRLTGEPRSSPSGR